jgi:hypothetical protein
LFDDEYYYIPSWEGAAKVLQLAQLFPDLHINKVNNRYGIMSHIEINSSYLDGNANTPNATPEEQQAAEASRESEKAALLQDLDKFLTGKDNHGRAMISEFRWDERLGKEVPDVKITPMKIDFNDEEMLKIWETANKALISAFQIPPALANVEYGSALSSGTEARTLYMIWLAVHATTYRDILLEPFYIAQDLNGWDATLRFGFRDFVLTTLSDEPTGGKKKGISEA